MLGTDSQYQTKSDMSEIQNTLEENKIKVMLECSLGRKVNIIDKNFFHTTEKKREDIYYKVWLYDNEIVKEINDKWSKNTSDRGSSKTNNIIINLGPIDLKDLKEKNFDKDFDKGNEIRERQFKVVLATLKVGKMETIFTNDINKYKNFESHSDCLYIHNSDSSNDQRKHLIYLKDSSRLFHHAVVSFTVDESDSLITCAKCGKENHDVVYCHNDKKYFCQKCNIDYHVNSKMKTIKNHKTTNYLGFSNVYKNTCKIHFLIPLEYFCLECSALFCHKCLDGSISKNHDKHNFKYVQNYMELMDDKEKKLALVVETKLKYIDDYLNKYNADSKELENTLNIGENELMESKIKNLRNVEQEALTRNTYLASLCIEMQRYINDIESKYAFLNLQKNNADMATYISMVNMFEKYITELTENFYVHMSRANIETITEKLVEMDTKTGSNNIQNNNNNIGSTNFK